MAATGVERPVMAVDGKTARRSHDGNRRGGCMRSASGPANTAVAGAGSCAEKSNEITAIPELLRLVDINGAIITIDAMGTQKAIAAQIVDSKADYLLALKGNQETMHQAVIDYIDDQLETHQASAQEHVTTEEGHGREEVRTYLQFPAPEELPGYLQWKGLKSIGIVTSRCLRDGKESVEVRSTSAAWRWMSSSRPPRARTLGIENTLHWSLDMTFREDESRIREQHYARTLHG